MSPVPSPQSATMAREKNRAGHFHEDSGRTCRAAADRSTRAGKKRRIWAYISIDLTGADGITKSSEDTAVTVEVDGAGTLLALGSARPNMGENFFSDTHTTYYGKALAVVRGGDAPEDYGHGEMQGLLPKRLELE